MRKRNWNKLLRVLSALPLLLFAVFLAMSIFLGGGPVTLPEEDLTDDLTAPSSSDSVEKGEPVLVLPGDYRDVVEKNVFSSSRRRPTSRYTPSGTGSDGSMGPADYTLLGVIVTGGEHSLAVIRRGGQGGEVKTYKLGETVDNLVLEEIFYDRVVLRQGEDEKVLELKPREEEKASLPAPPKTPPKSRPREGSKKNTNVEER